MVGGVDSCAAVGNLDGVPCRGVVAKDKALAEDWNVDTGAAKDVWDPACDKTMEAGVHGGMLGKKRNVMINK